MSANSMHAEKMRYRANHVHEPGTITDVFNGSHYQFLLNTIVPGGEDNPFFYFSDERDIALGLSMDGFAPFKRRDKTCWPVILFNYNLPPEICFQKKFCIHVATVPGPKKPWDWDSFCWPLVQELIQLELGVKAFNAISQALFLLHAYLILAFGDIPAMALVTPLYEVPTIWESTKARKQRDSRYTIWKMIS
jgi:Transposase family tnp2